MLPQNLLLMPLEFLIRFPLSFRPLIVNCFLMDFGWKRRMGVLSRALHSPKLPIKATHNQTVQNCYVSIKNWRRPSNVGHFHVFQTTCFKENSSGACTCKTFSLLVQVKRVHFQVSVIFWSVEMALLYFEQTSNLKYEQ